MAHKEIDDLEVKHPKRVSKNVMRFRAIKRNVQHVHWAVPYQKGSNIHLFFVEMQKKGGLSIKRFDRLIKRTGAAPNFILSSLRKGFSNKGFTWDFDDSRDRYSITNVKDKRKLKK